MILGDGLLRRVGNILNRAITNTNFSASRIGGDEFVILMVGANEAAVETFRLTIEELLHIDNQYYASQPIYIALGYATIQKNETVEQMLKRADQLMYKKKQAYYNA